MHKEEVLRPDAKGRITLGALAKGVSSYHVTINEDNSILLEPYTEIPYKERWIYENKEVFKKIKKGLSESAKNETFDLGDFTHYVKKDKTH